MSNISLTVASSDKEALVAGATMLLTLAGKVPAMELDDTPLTPSEHQAAEATIPVSEGGSLLPPAEERSPGMPPEMAAPYTAPAGPFYWHDGVSTVGICATAEELAGVLHLNPALIECNAESARQCRAMGYVVSNPHGLAIPEAAAVPPPPIADSAEAPAGPASTTPTAPVSDGAAAGASPSSVELDAEGLPWDGRIHARTKTKTANLHWKKKRGVDDATYQTVVAELRAVMAAPPAALPGVVSESVAEATPPIPNAAESFANQGAPVVTPPVVTTPVAAPPGVTTPPVVTPPVVGTEAPATFPEFLKAVSGLIGSQATTMESVVGILNTYSVPNMQMMGNRADLIPQVWFDIQASINA